MHRRHGAGSVDYALARAHAVYWSSAIQRKHRISDVDTRDMMQQPRGVSQLVSPYHKTLQRAPKTNDPTLRRPDQSCRTLWHGTLHRRGLHHICCCTVATMGCTIICTPAAGLVQPYIPPQRYGMEAVAGAVVGQRRRLGGEVDHIRRRLAAAPRTS